MPITRQARTSDGQRKGRTIQDACLDCPDCSGACWSVFELAFVPERVLHSNRTASA